MNNKNNLKTGLIGFLLLAALCVGGAVTLFLSQPCRPVDLLLKISGCEQVMPLIGTDRLRLSQDGNVLAVYNGNRMQVLNLPNNELLTDLVLYDNSMSATMGADLALTTDGAYAVAIRQNDTVFRRELVILDTRTPTPNLQVLPLPASHMPYKLAISPDDRLLASLIEYTSSGNKQYYAALFSLPDGELIEQIQVKTYGHDIAFAPDGRLAIAENANISILNLTSKKIETIISPVLLGQEAVSMAFSPDGSLLAVSINARAAGTNRVDIFQLQDGKIINFFSFPPSFSDLLTSFSPDGTSIAISTCETIEVYRISDKQQLKTYSKLWEGWLRHSCRMSPLQFTPDGKHVYYSWLEPDSILKFRYSD